MLGAYTPFRLTQAVNQKSRDFDGCGLPPCNVLQRGLGAICVVPPCNSLAKRCAAATSQKIWTHGSYGSTFKRLANAPASHVHNPLWPPTHPPNLSLMSVPLTRRLSMKLVLMQVRFVLDIREYYFRLTT